VHKTRKPAHADHGDALWQLSHGKDVCDYAVEARPRLTPATLGATLAQMQRIQQAAGRPALLVTDHVPRSLASKLRELRQQFIDAAGNAYLDAPGLLVFVAGNKSELKSPTVKGQALTVAGLKTLFALMCDPALANAPQRTIATTAGVALGAIPGVLGDLKGAGHLVTAGRRRRLDATRHLLDQWCVDYARR